MRQRRLLSSALIVLTLAMGVAIGTVISEQVSATQDGPTPLTIPEPVQLSNSFREVFEQVGPAVVNIEVEVRVEATEMISPFGGLEEFFGLPMPSLPDDQLPQVRPGEGSGFIVDPDGYILTNNHVVEGATAITVRLADDSSYDAEVVGTDAETDLAVIRITDPVSGLPTLTMGNSDGLMVGDWVLAVGSPFQLDQTLTAGIVSAVGRQANPQAQFQRFIQTDAAINPGNSGGPLVNLQGQVVGVNSAIVSGTRQFAGIGFAMPSNVAADVYNQIIATGRVTRGWIGIYYDADDLLEAAGHDQGVFVDRVVAGGPADEAGLESGDVITGIDGMPIVEGDDLLDTVVAKSVGDQVQLTVDRLGETVNLTLTIAERPLDPTEPDVTNNFPRRGAPNGSEFESSALGVTVRPLTSQIQQMPGGRGVEGVLIVNVEADSPAAEAGLARNLIISEVRIGRTERILITGVDDFRRADEAIAASSVPTIALRVMDPTAEFTPMFVPVPIR